MQARSLVKLKLDPVHIGIADGMSDTWAQTWPGTRFDPPSTRAFPNGAVAHAPTDVCALFYAHVYTHVHTHVYTHDCMHVYTHVCMYARPAVQCLACELKKRRTKKTAQHKDEEMSEISADLVNTDQIRSRWKKVRVDRSV